MLEEWRQGRDCSGRISEAYWKLLMKGSKVRSLRENSKLQLGTTLWKKIVPTVFLADVNYHMFLRNTERMVNLSR